MSPHIPIWGKGSAKAMFPYLSKRFGLKFFVETGTGFGDTLIFMASAFEKCWSIETDNWKYELCSEIFRHVSNTILIHGDSKTLLPRLLEETPNEKTLFFLDAHGEVGQNDGPLAEEIHAIQKYRPDSLIAIDDVGPNTHHDQSLHGIDLQGWVKEYKFNRIMFIHNGNYDLSEIK